MDVSTQQIDAFLETFPAFRLPGIRGYRATAADRFATTLALLPELPDPARVRVLEVGGRPYLLAALIEHFLGYDVHVANEPGAVAGEEDDVVTLVSDDGGEYSFPQTRLDIEHEQWPWPAASFDLVVYCEVIEHLAYDPTHTLVDAHRVLVPDTGTLLLSTPNALAWRYLVGIHRLRSVVPPLPPARPGRAAPRGSRLDARPPRRHLRHRRPAWNWRYAYPTAPHAIYTDSHAYGHITAPSVALHEDSPQLGPGFHAPDSWHGVRWTTEEAALFLLADGEQALEVTFYTGPRRVTATGWIEASRGHVWREREPWSAAPDAWATFA